MARGHLHHVELWVPDLGRAIASFGWLLEALGYTTLQDWECGRSWLLGNTYIVVEQSPALTSDAHDRNRPGLNHLALHAGTRTECDRITAQSLDHDGS
jgi:Glyoxalase/Bleomycin resistance protein/Dioxygenase superfamily